MCSQTRNAGGWGPPSLGEQGCIVCYLGRLELVLSGVPLAGRMAPELREIQQCEREIEKEQPVPSR